MTFVTQAACPSTCQWIDNKPPQAHDPLFSKPFCHAPNVKLADAASIDADFTTCKPDLDAAECVAPCVYNKGVELYPDVDFCAVSWMNPDVTTIKACATKSDS
jgi:hypothetical protein